MVYLHKNGIMAILRSPKAQRVCQIKVSRRL